MAEYERCSVPSQWQPAPGAVSAFVIQAEGPDGKLIESLLIEVESRI
jgi:hypothetical protein